MGVVGPSLRRARDRWPLLAVLSFVLLGLGNTVALLLWGVDPLWVVLVVTPILFFTIIGWLAFESERTGVGTAGPSVTKTRISLVLVTIGFLMFLVGFLLALR